jgi:hypothetical protein
LFISKTKKRGLSGHPPTAMTRSYRRSCIYVVGIVSCIYVTSPIPNFFRESPEGNFFRESPEGNIFRESPEGNTQRPWWTKRSTP